MIAMSPPWSAPEVVDRRSSGTVASEVWALAATVYTLAAQHAPFDIPGGRHSDEQLRGRIMRAKYVPTGREDAPPAFETALEAGLRRLPDDRYGSAREFGEALQAVELEMGLPVTALELPSAEWAPSAYAGDRSGAPVHSTVSVASQRQHVLDPLPRTGTQTRGEGRRDRIGRGILIGVIIGGAAVIGIVLTILLVVGR